MRKILNYGLIAILGLMTVMAPSCTKDLEDDIDEIRTQMTPLEAKIKAVETRLADLTSIEAEIKATKDKITTIEGQIPTLATKADLTALTTRVTALETWKVTVTTQLESIETQLGAITTANGALEEKLTAEILRIDGQFTAMTGKLETMENDIITKVDAKYADEIAKIAGIETRVGELEATMIIVKAASENAETADNARTEYEKIRNEIETAITNGVSAEELETAILGVEGKITTINSNLTAINADIDAIKGRIQAINFISDYADGKATVNSIERAIYSDLVLRFRVYPAAKAAELAKLFTTKPTSFLLNLNSVLETRATVETPELKIVSIVADLAKTGDIIVTACPNAAFKTSAEKTFSLSLDVVTEVKEGSTIALENTSSNVVAVHTNVIANKDILYTKKDSKVGEAIASEFEIEYRDITTVVAVEKDVLPAVTTSNNLIGFLKGYNFSGTYTSKVTKVALNEATGVEVTTSNVEELQTAAASEGFTLDIANGTVKVIKNDESKIGKKITLTIEGKIGETVVSSEGTVTVTIIPSTTERIYDAVVRTWDKELTTNSIEFDLVELATLLGGDMTVEKLATELSAINFTINGVDADKFSLAKVLPNHTKLRLLVRSTTSWSNQEYSEIVLKKELADKRMLQLVIPSITLKLPTITLTKAGGYWSTDGSKLYVKGTYDPAVGTSVFKMEGDLTNGFGPNRKTLEDMGVTLEFSLIDGTNLQNNWVLNSTNQVLTFKSFKTSDQPRVKTMLVYTDRTGRKQTLDVKEFDNVLVNPISPISPKITYEGTVDYTSANSTKLFNLDDMIRFTEVLRDQQLRTSSNNETKNQKGYYIENLTGFSDTFKSYDQFGLSTGPDYIDGAKYSIGSVKYASGATMDEATENNIKTGVSQLEKGKIAFDYGGIPINSDVVITINVTIANKWGTSTGAIKVNIKSNVPAENR